MFCVNLSVFLFNLRELLCRHPWCPDNQRYLQIRYFTLQEIFIENIGIDNRLFFLLQKYVGNLKLIFSSVFKNILTVKTRIHEKCKFKIGFFCVFAVKNPSGRICHYTFYIHTNEENIQITVS